MVSRVECLDIFSQPEVTAHFWIAQKKLQLEGETHSGECLGRSHSSANLV